VATALELDESRVPFARHVLQRTVVLPELRVVFLPVPKAGCTSVLWSLAALAGLSRETFAHSSQPEVSPALTVHDMSLWRPEHRLADYEPAEQERILGADGWFRFSLVRHPAARLWSAWQSKLLLREPRFVEAFGDEPWFPRVPERPADLVADFRRFVAAVGADARDADVHWAVQHGLVTQVALSHVGRVEQLSDTLALLRAHLPEPVRPDGFARANPSPLAMPAHAYDEAAAATLRTTYRDDFLHHGYEPAPPRDDAEAAAAWERRVAPLIGMVRAAIDANARIGQLHRLAQQRGRRLHTAEQQLEAAGVRRAGAARSPAHTNREGHGDFNVRWGWAEAELEPGVTAVVRVRDEARSLPWVLPALLRAVRRVVLVDNGSIDGTPELARRVARERGASDRLEVHGYPFAVARCGAEHLGVAADSVHSLAYFYNWSFAHVRTAYALKWDGDMVLTDAAVQALRDLAWQLEAVQAVVKVPRYPLYVVDERRAFIDLGLRNCEPWGWPNRPGFSFVKAMEWELPLWGADVSTVVLGDFECVELKHLDAEEFGHWSATDFARSARTRRKQREWEVFTALAHDDEPPAGVLAIEAPPGAHVIDFVRERWLPERARQA
jgi:hypothetical protein